MRSAASLLLLAWLAVAPLGLADTLSPMHCTSYQVGADTHTECTPGPSSPPGASLRCQNYMVGTDTYAECSRCRPRDLVRSEGASRARRPPAHRAATRTTSAAPATPSVADLRAATLLLGSERARHRLSRSGVGRPSALRPEALRAPRAGRRAGGAELVDHPRPTRRLSRGLRRLRSGTGRALHRGRRAAALARPGHHPPPRQDRERHRERPRLS